MEAEMRTQNDNPAYQRFAHLLTETGLYPARYADIFWNRGEDRKVQDVEVVFIPRESPALAENPEFWSVYRTYTRPWSNGRGNSCANWLTPDGSTPESIFGYLLRDGFADQNELRRALEEFSSIAECSWAREMLRGLR
jgi:hypothetical protein